MSTSPEKKRDLLIITQDIREISIFSQELIQIGLNPINELIPLFIGRRRNPKSSSKSGSESALTQPSVDRPLDHSTYAIDRLVDRTNCRSYRKCQSTGQLTDPSGFLFSVNIGRPVGQSILWVSTLFACQSTARSIEVLT